MSSLFVLQLSHLGSDQARVKATCPSPGELGYTIPYPFDPVTLRALLQLLEKRDLAFCRFDDEEMHALSALGVIADGRLVGGDELTRRIGRCLYQGLFPDSPEPDQSIRAGLALAMEQALQTRQPIPMQLCFDLNAVDLARIPWELLCSGDDPLVLRERLHLARHISFNRSTIPFPVAESLEVLVVSARPENIPPLDTMAEQRTIVKAFELAKDRIHVDVLQPPTFPALVDQIGSHLYHVIHFDGHGSFGRRCPFCKEFTSIDLPICANPECGALLHALEPEGFLAFEDRSRQAHLVTASDLTTALSMSHVRLFVANACQSAMVGGTNALNSLAPRLLREVPAVVGMQFSVPDQAAQTFAGRFYSALAQGNSIAAAVAEGRKALFESETWYIPVLYLRSQDGEGNLFAFGDVSGVRDGVIGGDAHGTRIYLWPTGRRLPDWAGLRPPQAAPYKYLSPFETNDTAVFYGREAETQGLVAELLHRRIEVLYGPPGVGKTSLVNAGLVPALLRHGYLVVTLREYSSPVGTLVKAVADSPALQVDLAGVDSLQSFVDTLQRDAGRPMVIVLDEFHEFLETKNRDDSRHCAFIDDVAACVQQDYPLPFCLLLVVEEGSLGHLAAFETELPTILEHRFLLRPMPAEQARRAIEGPLVHHEPLIRYDPKFLEKDLLPALGAEGDEPRINPTHLQIVCQELYQAVLNQAAPNDNVRVIGSGLYPGDDAEAILKRYLQERLRQRFPEGAQRDRLRLLLKQMVSVAGERVFVPAGEAAQEAELSREEAEEALRLLQKDAIIEGRQILDGEPVYSLSLVILADEVHHWFDPEEAKDRRAREVLRRAWDDWYEKAYLAREQGSDDRSSAGELLVEPARLREIRERRQRVPAQAEQLCLLLHSAVSYRCDMAFWTGELAQDDGARQLLIGIHRGPEPVAFGEADVRLALGAAALGIGPGNMGPQALARAAAGNLPGSVRHTAALALGAAWQTALSAKPTNGPAMSKNEVAEAVATLASAARAGLRWRGVQALAQMKASGLRLPAMPRSLQLWVHFWRMAIRLAEARWQLVAQAIGAGLGGGFGMMIPLGLVYVLAGLYKSPVIPSYMFVGWVVGVAFATGRWLLGTLFAGRAWRMLGGGVGFCLGLVALWPFTLNPSAWQLVSAMLAGAAVALGGELLARPRAVGPEQTRAIWLAGMGGGLGSALMFAATSVGLASLPFLSKPAVVAAVVDESWVAVSIIVIAGVVGAMMGFGLAGGCAAGELLWRRLAGGSTPRS